MKEATKRKLKQWTAFTMGFSGFGFLCGYLIAIMSPGPNYYGVVWNPLEFAFWCWFWMFAIAGGIGLLFMVPDDSGNTGGDKKGEPKKQESEASESESLTPRYERLKMRLTRLVKE
jgi:hypothetical protein